MKNSFKLAVMRIEDSVFVSVADSALANLKGVILLLCAVLSFSAYNILARKLVRDYTNWELSFATMPSTSLSSSFFLRVAISCVAP